MNTATNKELPSHGEQLFKEISEDERRRISKNFVFPALRNRTLLELHERGALIVGLAELSGLNRSHVGRVIKVEKVKRDAERLLMGRKKRR